MNYRTYGETLWEDEKLNLQVNEWQTRYFLIDSETGDKLNELVNGKKSLDKYYKGDILKWVKVIIVAQHKAREKEHTYHLEQASKQKALADYYLELLNKLQGY